MDCDIRLAIVGIIVGFFITIFGLILLGLSPKQTYMRAYEDMKSGNIEDVAKDWFPDVWIKLNSPAKSK